MSSTISWSGPIRTLTVVIALAVLFAGPRRADAQIRYEVISHSQSGSVWQPWTPRTDIIRSEAELPTPIELTQGGDCIREMVVHPDHCGVERQQKSLAPIAVIRAIQPDIQLPKIKAVLAEEKARTVQ